MSLRTLIPALAACCLWPLLAQGAEIEMAGTYDFPTSTTNAEAQEQFLLGVGYLHSFARCFT